MKKIKRIFLSTGYYSNVIIATVIEQISKTDTEYEDYLILGIDGQDVENNLAMLKLLNCNFKSIFNYNLKAKLKPLLMKNFKNVSFDEIYVDPLLGKNHCFKNYSHTHKFFGIDEGTISYTDTSYINKTIRIIGTKYLLCPEVLINQNHYQNIIKINHEIFKTNIKKLSSSHTSNYPQRIVLFLLAMEVLNAKQVNDIVAYFNLFTAQGYTIYIKEHPRVRQNIKADIISVCNNPEKIVELQANNLDNIIIAEQLMEIMKPDIIISFSSTALLNAYYLYNIPAFRLSHNLKLSVYRFKEIDKLLSAIPYLADFLKQDKFNAFEYCDNYSFYYMNCFKKLLYQEAFYLPAKVAIYLNLFFQSAGFSSMKNFFKLINRLVKSKS